MENEAFFCQISCRAAVLDSRLVIRTHLINRSGSRWSRLVGWLGATKEHSRDAYATEEQQSQPARPLQPQGLHFFGEAASLLVSQRFQTNILLPRASLPRQTPCNAGYSYL